VTNPIAETVSFAFAHVQSWDAVDMHELWTMGYLPRTGSCGYSPIIIIIILRRRECPVTPPPSVPLFCLQHA
jgi:hypothetical protein